MQLATLATLAVTIGFGQATPGFIADTVAGSLPAAPLVEFAENFDVRLGGKKPQAIRGRDLVALRAANLSQPAFCPPPYLLLTTGDRLPIVTPANPRLADESLSVTLAAPLAAEGFAVPQALATALVLAPGNLASESKGRDLVVLTSGDRVAGKLIKIDPQTGVQIDTGGEERSIPLERVGQIVFDADFQVRPKMTGPYADVIVKGGARLIANRVSFAGNRLAAATQLKHPISFPVGSLVGLRQRGANAIYLDDLKPKAFEMTPFLDTHWPLAVGRSTLGGQLKLGGDVFPLGIGVHSRSRVTYSLDPADEWFEAVVGVEPNAGKDAAVVIGVELDGKTVPSIARPLAADCAPARLRIDVRGTKTITLVTDFGPRGDVHGHAIWADARFLRK